MSLKTLILALATLLVTGCSEEPETYRQLDDYSKPLTKESPLSPSMAAAKTRSLALCSGCHGPTGINTTGSAPNLAGQHKAYLIKQLNDFKSGQRANHPPMTYIARMLSEEEIQAISEWFSVQDN